LASAMGDRRMGDARAARGRDAPGRSHGMGSGRGGKGRQQESRSAPRATPFWPNPLGRLDNNPVRFRFEGVYAWDAMNANRRNRSRLPGIGAALVSLIGWAALATPPVARASAIVAVDSTVSSDYVRTRLADGSLRPETFAFGKGGYLPWIMRDDTIDRLDFTTVAHSIAPTLAQRAYVTARDPDKTRLLIMVYWGTTPGAADMGFTPHFVNSSRLGLLQDHSLDLIDYQNASLLGYTSDGLIGTDYGYALQATALRHKVEDEVTEVEHSRYFVVLMAYDFQMMWKEKKPKLLWVTRLSIDERRNDFGRELPTMLRIASPYFGKSTGGLIRDVVPEGQVNVGELKSLGAEPEK
jgi:hypothetical protein